MPLRAPGTASGEDEEAKQKGPLNSLLEFVLIVAVALGLAFGIQALLVKPFRIPSGSMVPTLSIGQRVLVNRVTYRFSDPSRGDIVVFHPPTGAESNGEKCGRPRRADQACATATPGESETNFIKRIVAEPGDRIYIKANHVYVDPKGGRPAFRREGDSYAHLIPCTEVCNLPKPITIPPGHFFMMGDNRGESDDSRDWGPVPKKWIVGSAFFTYWPPKRIGTL